jgi:hypothetical protein
MSENTQKSTGQAANFKFNRGGAPTEMGPFIGEVMNNVDPTRQGRLQVYIQQFAGGNWNRVVCNLSREIKHSVFNSIDDKLFKEQSIVDLDLRTSGISHGKKSFFNLEVNLYTTKEFDFKSPELKESVKEIIRNIVRDNVIENKYFDFSISKSK